MSSWALTVLGIFVVAAIFGVAILVGAASVFGQVLLFIVLVAVIMGVMHNRKRRA